MDSLSETVSPNKLPSIGFLGPSIFTATEKQLRQEQGKLPGGGGLAGSSTSSRMLGFLVPSFPVYHDASTMVSCFGTDPTEHGPNLHN